MIALNKTFFFAYLTRSQTVMRFPIGLKSEFPSGEKAIGPCLYTTPQRFENYNKTIRTIQDHEQTCLEIDFHGVEGRRPTDKYEQAENKTTHYPNTRYFLFFLTQIFQELVRLVIFPLTSTSKGVHSSY